MSKPLFFRLAGTVILTIWWKIILLALYTGSVVSFYLYLNLPPDLGVEKASITTLVSRDDDDHHHDHDHPRVEFPQILVPVLGVVTGLLLVFRTNTAYDRYWEGRRTWSTMTVAIRTLTRCIWVMVASEGTAKEVVEKTSAINLLIAFAYATKNYLREEYSYEEPDLYHLIRHIPRFSKPSTNMAWDVRKGNISDKLATPQSQEGRSNRRAALARQLSLTAYAVVTPTNIPIELSYYIASYIKKVNDGGMIDSASLTQMNNALTSLVDSLTVFERIQRTPIPLAYSVHLNQAVWLYLLVLPFHVVGELGWFTVLAVMLASFALLGLLGIGNEIENPFGYHPNDLPLDDFCKVIQVEIQTIIGYHIRNPDIWILSKHNRPLGRESGLSAPELIKMEEPEVQNLLTSKALRLSRMGLDKIIEEEEGALMEVVVVDGPPEDGGKDDIDGDEKDGEIINLKRASVKKRH